MEILRRERGWVAVERIATDSEALLRRVTADEADESSRFPNPRRRLEWLSWRAMLQELLPGAVVGYDQAGIPLLQNSPDPELHYISVSHSADYAVIACSSKPCGVDIETLGRDFTRIAPRFVSRTENALPEASHPLFLPALWCAKEAIYKFAGIEGLALTRDIEIISCNLEADRLGGRFRKGGHWHIVSGIEILHFPGALLAVIL